MDKEEIFKYWKDTSDKDYITMNNLFASKDYSWTALKSKISCTHFHRSNLYPSNVIYWNQSFFIFAGKVSLKQ